MYQSPSLPFERTNATAGLKIKQTFTSGPKLINSSACECVHVVGGVWVGG